MDKKAHYLALEQYLEERAEKERQGKVSRLDAIELYTLELFAHWLDARTEKKDDKA